MQIRMTTRSAPRPIGSGSSNPPAAQETHASARNYSASRYSSFMSELDAVLESAARLQRLIPDAVPVGGSAAAYHAQHRDSFDHGHVMRGLEQRFGAVLDALESDPEWVFNRSTPGKIILGELGGIEAGVRQMIRTVPLEVEEVSLPSGQRIRAPTAEEALRIKAWLIIRRNQVRDYLDVAALSGVRNRLGGNHFARYRCLLCTCERWTGQCGFTDSPTTQRAAPERFSCGDAAAGLQATSRTMDGLGSRSAAVPRNRRCDVREGK